MEESDAELEGFTVALIKGLMIEIAAEEKAAGSAQRMEALTGNNFGEPMEDEEDFEDSDIEDDYEEGDFEDIDDEEGSEEWVEDESQSEGPCTEEEYREELHFALTSSERPGSFCAEGTLKAFHPPGLLVARLGPVGLPLTAPQAKELARVCSQAPFGRREATLYDPSVRRCLQLSPDQFRLQGPDWAAQVQRLVNLEIKRGLGVPGNVQVVPQLYKLLLYETGGFFKPHTDSEKEDGMFGTLAIVLPSVHNGGELVVRHGGREDVLDFASRCPYHVHWAAFYADCEHQVLPVKSGHRLVLVYNLVAPQGSASQLAPADNRQPVRDALAALRAWSEDEDGPTKLVVPLEHQYSSKSLSFNGLKGPDIATVDILLQAAKVPDRPPFHFFLGMLKMSESGAEDFDDDWDTTLELTDIVAPPGETVRYSKLECDEDELVPEGALDDHGWDHERSMDTGNEGVTVERWYRHAALIVWPHSKHWDVACISNIGKAIKEASDLVASSKGVQEALEETLAAGGRLSRGEAALVVELVFEHGEVHALAELRRALHTICRHGSRLTSAQAQTLTRLVVKHGDVDMARALLSNSPSPADSPLVPTLAARFGWAALSDDILALLTSKCDSNTTSLADCFKLLLRIAPKAPETTPPDPSAAFEKNEGEGHVAEAAGSKLKEEEEQSSEGKRLTQEAVEQHGFEASTSGQASESTRVAVEAESRTGRSSWGLASGSKAPAENPIRDSSDAAGPAPPRKATKEEQEREEVCRRAVTSLVERISSSACQPGGLPPYLDYSRASYTLTSQNIGPLVRLIERFGAAAFAPATDALIQNKVSASTTLAAELLWDFVRVGHAKRPKGSLPDLSPGALAFYRQFAAKLVEKLIQEPDPQPEDRPYNPAYLPPPRSPQFAALCLKTLHSLEVDRTVLDSVVDHFLATPNAHPIPNTLLPALKELVAWFGEGPMDTPWFAKLLGGCLERLERDCAEAPPEPKNWALPATCDCHCSDCNRLLGFCRDPKRTEMAYTATGSMRQHLKESISRNGMPVRISEVIGVPGAPLLCIKHGSEGKSDEKALMLLHMRRDTYQQSQIAKTQLLELRQQVEGEERRRKIQIVSLDIDATEMTID